MTLKEFLELSEQRFPPAQEKGWTIVRRDGKVETPPRPTFETEDDAQKHLMTKMFANHHEFKVVEKT